jgi:nitrate reductase gamma subunit
MALVFWSSLSPVAIDHRAEAPAFFHRTDHPWITGLSVVDRFFEIGISTLYLSDAAFLTGLSFLFLCRVVVPQLHYLSLFSDYFSLFLILGIVSTDP